MDNVIEYKVRYFTSNYPNFELLVQKLDLEILDTDTGEYLSNEDILNVCKDEKLQQRINLIKNKKQNVKTK